MFKTIITKSTYNISIFGVRGFPTHRSISTGVLLSFRPYSQSQSNSSGLPDSRGVNNVFYHNFSQKRQINVRRKPPKSVIVPLDDRYNMEWPKLTFFGDSITRRANDVDEGCWGSMIESKVNHYFDVDYRGFEGYNTRWGLELTPKLFPRSYLEKVDIMTIFFGHNDSWEVRNPLRISPEEFESNYRSIVKYFLENGLDKSKIILMTPSWFYLEDYIKFLTSLGFPEMGKTLEDATKYAEIVTRIAHDNGLEVVDMFSVTLNHKPVAELFCDGVHYSKLGAKKLYENLFPVIQKKIEGFYKKPLNDIRHAPTFDQIPEVKAVFDDFLKSSGSSSD